MVERCSRALAAHILNAWQTQGCTRQVRIQRALICDQLGAPSACTARRSRILKRARAPAQRRLVPCGQGGQRRERLIRRGVSRRCRADKLRQVLRAPSAQSEEESCPSALRARASLPIWAATVKPSTSGSTVAAARSCGRDELHEEINLFSNQVLLFRITFLRLRAQRRERLITRCALRRRRPQCLPCPAHAGLACGEVMRQVVLQRTPAFLPTAAKLAELLLLSPRQAGSNGSCPLSPRQKLFNSNSCRGKCTCGRRSLPTRARFSASSASARPSSPAPSSTTARFPSAGSSAARTRACVLHGAASSCVSASAAASGSPTAASSAALWAVTCGRLFSGARRRQVSGFHMFQAEWQEPGDQPYTHPTVTQQPVLLHGAPFHLILKIKWCLRVREGLKQ